MPFLNYNNRHFTTTEQTALQDALAALQTAVQDKLANLTPKERQDFGSVNEQNKLFVNKVKDYRDSQPNLSSTDVNWEEFTQDYQTRNILQDTIDQLTELVRGLENAKILHDWDNYQSSLDDYRYTQYKNQSGVTGYHTKEEELKQFFPRNTSENNNNSTENPSV